MSPSSQGHENTEITGQQLVNTDKINAHTHFVKNTSLLLQAVLFCFLYKVRLSCIYKCYELGVLGE